MKKVYTVDRCEGDFFVCVDDNGDTLNIAVSEIPSPCGEGWKIVFSDDEIVETIPPDTNRLNDLKCRLRRLSDKQ